MKYKRDGNQHFQEPNELSQQHYLQRQQNSQSGQIINYLKSEQQKIRNFQLQDRDSLNKSHQIRNKMIKKNKKNQIKNIKKNRNRNTQWPYFESFQKDLQFIPPQLVPINEKIFDQQSLIIENQPNIFKLSKETKKQKTISLMTDKIDGNQHFQEPNELNQQHYLQRQQDSQSGQIINYLKSEQHKIRNFLMTDKRDRNQHFQEPNELSQLHYLQRQQDYLKSEQHKIRNFLMTDKRDRNQHFQEPNELSQLHYLQRQQDSKYGRIIKIRNFQLQNEDVLNKSHQIKNKMIKKNKKNQIKNINKNRNRNTQWPYFESFQKDLQFIPPQLVPINEKIFDQQSLIIENQPNIFKLLQETKKQKTKCECRMSQCIKNKCRCFKVGNKCSAQCGCVSIWCLNAQTQKQYIQINKKVQKVQVLKQYTQQSAKQKQKQQQFNNKNNTSSFWSVKNLLCQQSQQSDSFSFQKDLQFIPPQLVPINEKIFDQQSLNIENQPNITTWSKHNHKPPLWQQKILKPPINEFFQLETPMIKQRIAYSSIIPINYIFPAVHQVQFQQIKFTNNYLSHINQKEYKQQHQDKKIDLQQKSNLFIQQQLHEQHNQIPNNIVQKQAQISRDIPVQLQHILYKMISQKQLHRIQRVLQIKFYQNSQELFQFLERFRTFVHKFKKSMVIQLTKQAKKHQSQDQIKKQKANTQNGEKQAQKNSINNIQFQAKISDQQDNWPELSNQKQDDKYYLKSSTRHKCTCKQSWQILQNQSHNPLHSAQCQCSIWMEQQCREQYDCCKNCIRQKTIYLQTLQPIKSIYLDREEILFLSNYFFNRQIQSKQNIQKEIFFQSQSETPIFQYKTQVSQSQISTKFQSTNHIQINHPQIPNPQNHSLQTIYCNCQKTMCGTIQYCVCKKTGIFCSEKCKCFCSFCKNQNYQNRNYQNQNTSNKNRRNRQQDIFFKQLANKISQNIKSHMLNSIAQGYIGEWCPLNQNIQFEQPEFLQYTMPYVYNMVYQLILQFAIYKVSLLLIKTK